MPTEDIFNTDEEIVPVSPNAKIQIKVEKYLASSQFIQDSYFL